MEYYLAVKKKEILPFVTAWMNLEIVILSETSQSEKDKCHMISLICGIDSERSDQITGRSRMGPQEEAGGGS